jgi:hypothetical protein
LAGECTATGSRDPDAVRSALRCIVVFDVAGAPQGIQLPRDVDGFSTRYSGAIRDQLEAWKDDLLTIADDERLEPNDRRIRIDTRKWLMSKLHPSKYGDNVTVAGDPDAPLQHVVKHLDVATLSGPELDALERFTDARLAAKDVEDQRGSDAE